MTATWFYDLVGPLPWEGDPSAVSIDRIYCLDFDRWSEDHWRTLYAIYPRLPGDYRDGVDLWFGDDEETPPYLSASVEPPGLQVSAVLPGAQWAEWHARFVEEVLSNALPTRGPS